MQLRGFVSYSHDDMETSRALEKYLRLIARSFDEIELFWFDRSNRAGTDFRSKYLAEIDRASIFVPLLSVHWLNSDEIFTHEWPAIEAQLVSGSGLVLPVIVDGCMADCIPHTLQAAPRDDTLRHKPLLDWEPIRHGYESVVRDFKQSIADHFGIVAKPVLLGDKA